MDSSRNLMVSRGEKSVWDKPTLAASLANCDRERWLMAAGGTGLVMIGARRGGVTGGLTAMLGAALAVRAAMGHHDLHVAQGWVDRALSERGWRHKDVVSDASEESFPASDSPSWTASSGTTPQR